MAFQFYEIHEKGANSAVISFQSEVTRLIGDFASDNMLKRFCAYKRGTGNSMVENFKFIPATAYTRDDKTVDLNKLESDYIRNGRKSADREAYLAKITQLKTQRFRMQIFPKTAIIESEPINSNDAITLGGGDQDKGVAMMVAEDSFVQPMLASETHENNATFIEALQNLAKNGFTYKKTRWDGGIAEDGDSSDITIPLPEYCKYATAAGYIKVEDLIRIRAQMQNNMTDAPELQRQMTIIVSPNTAANMIINNADKDNILHNAVFGEKGAVDTKLPTAYGFSFYVNSMVPDNEAFVITNGVTLGVYDWGTRTMHKGDADVWEVSTIRRRPNYGVKVIQPLSYLHITLTGKDAAYDDDRLAGLETTTDEALKPIRKKVSAGA